VRDVVEAGELFACGGERALDGLELGAVSERAGAGTDEAGDAIDAEGCAADDERSGRCSAKKAPAVQVLRLGRD